MAAEMDIHAALRAALAEIAPSVDFDVWLSPLADGFAAAAISTPQRIAAALGQFVAEAGEDFGELRENLNYTHAQHIHDVFPREFPTLEEAALAVGNPELLGDKVYAGRMGNGGEESGDGYCFRGAGLLQLTGREEITPWADSIGMTPEAAADWAGTPAGAASSACWYWSTRNLNQLADAWSIQAITLRVNGSAMLAAERRLAVSNAALAAIHEAFPTS